MENSAAAITIRGLVKRFKQVEAVAGIDLDVWPGGTFGFLGPAIHSSGETPTVPLEPGTYPIRIPIRLPRWS